MPTAEFTTAAENVKTLAKSPSNDEKLSLYALYKVKVVTHLVESLFRLTLSEK